ncbi:MAG: lipoate--protein ligase family protein [Coriobacteriia bacterium]
MEPWRLIVHGAAEGAWNMAADRAILDAHEAGEAPPTVRLYRWARPTVSLGRFQPLSDVDVDACLSSGVDVCRRPTGGRGVLHDDELTYSIVAGEVDRLPRRVAASYRYLCSALIEAYEEIGIHAALTARVRGRGGAGACYLHATPADLSIGAAKLSGSAQVWSRDSCLQHGSFVVSRHVEREAAVFRLGAGGAEALAATTDTISSILGRAPNPGELLAAVTSGLERGLGVRFVTGTLTERESAYVAVSAPRYRVLLG